MITLLVFSWILALNFLTLKCKCPYTNESQKIPQVPVPQQFSWTNPGVASAELLLSPCEWHTHPPGSWVTSLCSGICKGSHCDAHTLMSPAAGTPDTQALWWVVALQPWHSDLNTHELQQEEPLHSGQHLEREFNEKTHQTTDIVQGMLMRASLC